MLNKKNYLWLHLFLLIISILSTFPLINKLTGLNNSFKLFIFLTLWYMLVVAIISLQYKRKSAQGTITILYGLILLNTLLMINIAHKSLMTYTLSILTSTCAILITIMYHPKRQKRQDKEVHFNIPVIKMDKNIIEEPIREHSQVFESNKEKKLNTKEKELESNEEELEVIDARNGILIQPIEINDTKIKTTKTQPGKKKQTKIKKIFSPSRFIASKNGSTYHSPKCDWAKKISKKNIIWFNTTSTAKRKGYKKCNTCL